MSDLQNENIERKQMSRLSYPGNTLLGRPNFCPTSCLVVDKAAKRGRGPAQVGR